MVKFRDPYLRALVENTATVMKLRRIGLCTEEYVEEAIAKTTRRFFEGQRRMGRCK